MKKILSIVGVHASETPEKIFDRKIQDIEKKAQLDFNNVIAAKQDLEIEI